MDTTSRSDPLHDGGSTDAVWTTVNIAEALPGVTTPLGWTWFFEACELGLRGAFADIGAIPPRDVRIFDDLDDRFVGVFYGHCAGNLDLMRRMGDQMPGSSGEAVEEQYFAAARAGIESTRNLHRVPIVLAKLPVNAWRARRKVGRLRGEVDDWWRACVAVGSTTNETDARGRFSEAMRYWRVTCRAHTVVSMVAQGLYEQVRRACAASGQPGLELRLVNTERGIQETETITHLWEVANGQRSMERFIAAHGFHGPREGELSSRSWREDPVPLGALLDALRDHEAPNGATRQRPDRAAAETQLRGAAHGRARVMVPTLLRLARTFIPLREDGRATFLKSYDVARCMARRIGAHLVERDLIDDADDIFFLTVHEVLHGLPADPRSEIAYRRARRERYLRCEVPERWQGQPEPIVADDTGAAEHDRSRHLDAIGASAGCVEGRALVVVDPIESGDLHEGDVLVCRTTDPSWASLFFLVSACVIDVGGPMSHGAILARELGIPCVINTRDGTRQLRTGDRVRVDGTAGTVDVLVPVST